MNLKGKPRQRGLIRRGKRAQVTMATEAAVQAHDIYFLACVILRFTSGATPDDLQRSAWQPSLFDPHTCFLPFRPLNFHTAELSLIKCQNRAAPGDCICVGFAFWRFIFLPLTLLCGQVHRMSLLITGQEQKEWFKRDPPPSVLNVEKWWSWISHLNFSSVINIFLCIYGRHWRSEALKFQKTFTKNIFWNNICFSQWYERLRDHNNQSTLVSSLVIQLSPGKSFNWNTFKMLAEILLLKEKKSKIYEIQCVIITKNPYISSKYDTKK